MLTDLDFIYLEVMQMPSFKIIRHLVLEKTTAKILMIYGHGGQLGQATKTILQNP